MYITKSKVPEELPPPQSLQSAKLLPLIELPPTLEALLEKAVL